MSTSTSQPFRKYRVCEASVCGNRMLYVLHGRGGSSALVTLANIVLRIYGLGWRLITEGGIKGRPKYVKSEVLEQIIEFAVVTRLNEWRELKKFKADAMLSHWDLIKPIIRGLPKCSLNPLLSLNPLFTSCNAFEAANEVQILCQLLGFNLYHGLVVSPEEARAIGPKSYNEIAQMVPSKVEKNRALKRFIESSKDGLTALGLRSLKEVIEEANGAVLFINNQYSYVVKVRGDLLLLVSDEEQAKKTPDAQWKVLGEVSEKGKLLDSEFKEIKQLTIGPNVEESALKMQRMLIEDEARQKMKQSRPPKKSRTRNKGKINVPRPESVVASDDTEELEGSISNEERNQELDMEETEEEKDDHMSETFGDFLRKFTEQGTSAPFFEGQVKALDHCKSYTLTIKFKDLESYDKENARYVILDRLNQCACKFLLEHDEFKTKPDEVSKNTKIEITDLPAPNSVQPFSKFALEHAMHKIWELSDYGAKKVSSTTFIGRKAAHGYLNCMLRKHKSGLCWNGSFSLEDFVVLDHNGVLEFVIVKQAYEEYSQERAISDFNTFCVILFWYFEADEADEKHPPYFHQFQLDYLINMPKREDTQAYDRWDRYMADHFAFKAPQAISTLITETYEVCDSERIGPDYGLLNLIGDLDPWATNVTNSGSISLMDTFEFGSAIAGTSRYNILNYWRMLVFGRHFTYHMLRAKRDENVFIQVQDLLIVHLMLGFVLKGQLARVIRFIMQENGFSDGLFSSAWRHFQASETFDEEPKQPDMLPGGGANTSSSQVVAS